MVAAASPLCVCTQEMAARAALQQEQAVQAALKKERAAVHAALEQERAESQAAFEQRLAVQAGGAVSPFVPSSPPPCSLPTISPHFLIISPHPAWFAAPSATLSFTIPPPQRPEWQQQPMRQRSEWRQPTQQRKPRDY